MDFNSLDSRRERVNYQQGGTGFLGLLGLLFIALKLTGYISWSWFYVLMPIWLPFAIVLAILAFAFTFALIDYFSKR